MCREKNFFRSLDLIKKFGYNLCIKGGAIMPHIRSSADLRNNYNEISTFCHDHAEPVFITKNGRGDLAVMSIETYEQLTSRFELYTLLKKGLDDVAEGRTRPFSEAMAELRSRRVSLPPSGGKVPPKGADEGAGRASSSYGKRR
jgi:prevent-host-death family protein